MFRRVGGGGMMIGIVMRSMRGMTGGVRVVGGVGGMIIIEGYGGLRWRDGMGVCNFLVMGGARSAVMIAMMVHDTIIFS